MRSDRHKLVDPYIHTALGAIPDIANGVAASQKTSSPGTINNAPKFDMRGAILDVNRQRTQAGEIISDAIAGAYFGLFCAVSALLLDIGGARQTVMITKSPTFEFLALLVLYSMPLALGMAIIGLAMRLWSRS